MLKRLLYSVFSIFIITVVSFTLNELSPKDYTIYFGGTSPNVVSKEAIKNIEKRYDLDKPLYERYMLWLKRFVNLDFGKSMITNRDVKDEFFTRFIPSFIIAISSISIAIMLSVLLAYFSVLNSIVDQIIKIISAVFISVPLFLIFILLLIFVTPNFPYVPIVWTGEFGNFLIPVIVISLFNAFFISRIIRNKLYEIIHTEYFIAALSRGLSFSTAVIKHGIINSLSLLISVTGIRLIGLLSGLVLVESIFSIPGIGSYVFESITNRDLPVIQFYIVFIGLSVTTINLAVDLLTRFFNPKISDQRLT